MTTVRDWLGQAGVDEKKRALKSVRPYLHLFPRAKGKTTVVKRNAGVEHTVRFIPLMVKHTLHQTEKFVLTMLRPTLKGTLAGLFQWTRDHIGYVADGDNERVRDSARLINDQKGDCDCQTAFWDSCLENIRRLNIWQFRIYNRITKYTRATFQHIYPFIITSDGEQIILDTVTPHFNYEEPYTEKQDHQMDLEYLSGFDGMEFTEESRLFADETPQSFNGAVEYDLGKVDVKKFFSNSGKVLKKVVHTVNKVNPATALLRTGMLAAMKQNVLNVAGRIKWSYLDARTAAQKKLKMDRHEKLVKLRDKLEKIFFGAGGDPNSLKTAILTGKGNKGGEVAGFGLIPIYAMQHEDAQTLREIIGPELYDKETAHLSGLGEPVTIAAMTAATAAIAAIATALKQIGPIKDGEKDSDDPNTETASIAPNETVPDSGGASDASNVSNAKSNGEEPGFWSDPIGWAKANPVKALGGIAVVSAAVYFGYKAYNKSKSEKENGSRSLLESESHGRSGVVREKIRAAELAEY